MARGLFRHPPQPQQRLPTVAPPGDCYHDVILADSPTFVAPLDEASGSVTDIVGSKVGTTSGTPTYGVTGPVTGDTAIDFDADADAFSFADHADLDLGTGAFSVECWIARDTDLGAVFATAVDKGTNAYQVGISDTDHYFFAKSGVAIAGMAGETVAADGVWHHVVWTVTAPGASPVKHYVDGVDRTSTLTSNNNTVFADNASALLVGDGPADSHIGGKVAWVALYKSVLTPAKVQAHYNAATVACAAPGAQSITLPLLDASPALYAPSVAAQPVTVTLAVLDAVNAVYAPSLTPKNTITLAVLDSAPALYAPAVGFGLTLGLLTSTSALYAPSVGFTLTVPLLDAGPALYAPTIVPGPAALTIPVLDAVNALYAPTLAPQPVTVTLAVLDAANALYAPSVGFTITLGWIDGASALYAPVTYLDQFLTPPLLDAVPALYAPTLLATNTLTLAVLDASNAVYAPTIAPQPVTVTLGLLDASNALYAPTVAQVGGVTQSLTLGLLEGGAAYAGAVLATSPVAYWRLGETSGSAIDASGHGYDLGYVGSPTRGASGLLGDDSDKAVTLNGTTQWLYSASSVPRTTVYSLAGWVNLSDLDSTIVCMVDGPSLIVSGSGEVQLLKEGDGSKYYVTAAGAVSTGSPHFVVVTKTGTTVAMYVDGVSLSVSNTGGDLTGTTGTTGVYIGTLVGLFGFLGGTVDEVAIYDAVLTPTQVATLYRTGLSRLYAPSVAAKNTITLPLLDSGPALYSPTLTAKSTLTLALLDSVSAIYAPTVAPQPVTITLGQLDAVYAIYAPTVRPAAWTITLALLDSAPTVYAPTVIQAQFVTLAVLDSGPALYAPTLPRYNTLTLGLLDAGPALYAPVIYPDLFITLDLLDSGGTPYAPTIATGGTIALVTLDSGPTLYAPTVSPQAVGITVPQLDSVSALYAPTIRPTNTVTLGLLDGLPALYAPTLLAKSTVTLGALDSVSALYAPTLAVGAVSITVPYLDSVPITYAPSLTGVGGGTQSLTLGLLDSGSALYAPTVTPAAITLTPPVLTSVSAVYAPTLVNLAPYLVLPTIDAGAALYAPAVTPQWTITVPVIDGVATVYAPTLAKYVTLGLTLVDSGRELYPPTLEGGINLPIADIAITDIDPGDLVLIASGGPVAIVAVDTVTVTAVGASTGGVVSVASSPVAIVDIEVS